MISAHYLSELSCIIEVIEVGYLARTVMHKFLIWKYCSCRVSKGLLTRIRPLDFLYNQFLVMLIVCIRLGG